MTGTYQAAARTLRGADSVPAYQDKVRSELAGYQDDEAPAAPQAGGEGAAAGSGPPDVHQVLSLLREHPAVMRAMGLILTLPLPAAVLPADVAIVPFVRETAWASRELMKLVYSDGLNDGGISFDGFSVPYAAFERDVPAGGKVMFSVRPHSMRLSETPPAARDGSTSLDVIVLERAYLGEHWDYVVRPRQGGASLRVMTAPTADIPVGASAWLEVEPLQMALIT